MPVSSVDRPIPQPTGREVAASYSKAEVISGGAPIVSATEVSAAKNIKNAKSESGAHHSAVELALTQIDEGKGASWSGARETEVSTMFTDDKLKPQVEARVKAINTVRQGLELINLPKHEQSTKLKELQDSGLVEAGVTVDTLISSAQGILVSDEAFAVCFPDIAGSSMTPDQKAQWVKGLLEDPALRTNLSKAMGEWQERVLKFPVVSETKGAELADQKTILDADEKAAKGSLDSLLNSFISSASPEQKSALDSLLKNGNSQDITTLLAQISNVTPTELKVIQTYNKAVSDLEEMNANIRAGRIDIKSRTKNAELFTTEKTRLENLTKNAPPKFIEYSTAADAANTIAFKNQLKKYQETCSSQQRLDTEIKNNKSTSAEKQASFGRETQEQQATNELDTIISSAIYKTYQARENFIMEGKQAQAAEAKEQAIAEGNFDEAKVQNMLLEGWIKPAANGNPEEIDLTKIRDDVTYASQYGPDGVRIQMVKVAGMIDGNQDYGVGKNTKKGSDLLAAIDARTMTASEILAYLKTDTVLEQRMAHLYDKDGLMKKYTDTLMLSYTKARRYMKMGTFGRYITYGGKKAVSFKEVTKGKVPYSNFRRDLLGMSGQFDLKPGEWAGLFEKFGKDIKTGVQLDKDQLQLYDEMKGMGVASESTLKMWLYILGLLGITITTGGLGGLGIGAASAIFPGIGLAGGALGGAAIGAGSGLGIGGIAAAKTRGNIH